MSGDWPMYRHDLAGTGYSPLAQITTSNVGTLSRLWTYSLHSEAPAAGTAPGGPAGNPNSQATPIVVNNVMYLPAADRVVALEPATGREVWRHLVVDGAPARRGVAYWSGEDGTPPASSSRQDDDWSRSTPAPVHRSVVSARQAKSTW